MTKLPLFSVIIPTYNRASLLKIAINSVLKQDFSDFELIIVDDGSDDLTNQVVESIVDARIRYFYQENQERSAARNNGILRARGKFICFLDDDDYYLHDHLLVFYKALLENDFSETILRTGFIQLENNLEIGRSMPFLMNGDKTPIAFCASYFCGVVTLCIPRVFLQTHNFPVEYRHWQDTHLILRLLALHPFEQLDAYTYIYVQHERMGSRSIYQYSDSKQRIQSNVDAMIHLFENYDDLVGSQLPKNTLNLMVCKKFLNHANGSLINGNIKLGIHFFMESVKYNRGPWFLFLYLKFLVKIPTKVLLNLPKAP